MRQSIALGVLLATLVSVASSSHIWATYRINPDHDQATRPSAHSQQALRQDGPPSKTSGPYVQADKDAAWLGPFGRPSSGVALADKTPTNLTVSQQPGADEYVVVVDCGSSGSRVQIYRWPRGASRSEIVDKTQTLLDPSNQPLSKRIRPGLSSLRDNPEAASDYLMPIMQFASDHVPREQHQNTPVYVLGTAGLRSLSLTERVNILEDVMRDLRKEFDFQGVVADVISGSDEGFFQWLSMNRLADRLGSNFNQAQGAGFHFQSADRKRYGLVEMGGVSAQVAFEVTPAMDRLISQRLKHAPGALSVFRNLRLDINLSDREPAGENMRVFSVSFLGFGSDSARSLASDLLARDAMRQLSRRLGGALLPLLYQPNSTLVVDDPCLPRDADYSVLKPASLMYNPGRSIGYTYRPRDQAVLVKFVGRSNFAQCLALVNRLIAVARHERTTCMQLDAHGVCEAPLMGTNFIPWRQLQFLAIGDLYYTTELLGVSGHYSGIALYHQAARVCAKTIEQVNAEFSASDEFSRKRNMQACFKATWILSWLSSVLRMPVDGSVDVATTNQVSGQDIDWKLGAVIAETVGYKFGGSR